MKKYTYKCILMCLKILFIVIVFISCNENNVSILFSENNGKINFENKIIKLEIDDRMRMNVFRKSQENLLTIIQPELDPNTLIINKLTLTNFHLDKSKINNIKIIDQFGTGRQLKLTGIIDGPSKSVIEKTININMYKNYPEAAFINVSYKNLNSTQGLYIEKETNNSFTLDASLSNPRSGKNDFWIFQGGSYKERPDWILPVTADFSFNNYQGQVIEKDEVGGGIPVLDVWSKETGLLIGSLRDKPTLLSLPAKMSTDSLLSIGIEYSRNRILFEKEYNSIPSIIIVHEGDYFNGLKTYGKIMSDKGFDINDPPEDAYDAIWCGWGFGEDLTQEKMIEAIPVVRDFGFKVVTVDAGWFYYNGDYFPRDDIFPNGDEDLRRFTKTFHDEGFKIKLWITTGIAGEKLSREHPDWLIKDKNGKNISTGYMKKQITPLICPALPEVQEYYRELVKKIISEWDFDGFKIDQNIINAVSECYAENHNHESPAESFESLPEIYKILYEESLKLKKDAIIEVCPCGMVPSFYKMPYYNQPVSSDFNTPWQIRHRGKTIKALMGSNAAFYGDHVERHFDNTNYPSMIGVGGIPGSMLVLREEDNADFLRIKYPGFLTPERTAYISKWLKIYNDYYLSKGEYLNLYDIAFDKPEAHAIKKDGIMYYAFYADKWNGKIEFRGLDKDKEYKIEDYVNKEEIGHIKGSGTLETEFNGYLLLKAVPE